MHFFIYPMQLLNLQLIDIYISFVECSTWEFLPQCICQTLLWRKSPRTTSFSDITKCLNWQLFMCCEILILYNWIQGIFMWICICETFKTIWCAFICCCELFTCLYHVCCFVGLQKYLNMSSRGEDPAKKTERSPFSVEWLNSCYQQTLLPDAPWHGVRNAKVDWLLIDIFIITNTWTIVIVGVNGDFFRWRVRLPSLSPARWRNSLVNPRERRPWCSP